MVRFRYWQDLGMDLRALVGLPMTADLSTGILHGEAVCSQLSADVTSHALRPLTLDDELCDICWGWAVPSQFGEILDTFTEIDDIFEALEWGRHKGLTSEGFPSLVKAIGLLPCDREEDRKWAEALRKQLLEEFSSEFAAPLPELRARALKRVLGWRRPSGSTGMFLIDAELVTLTLQSLPVADRELAALWWDPDAGWPGFVCRGPLEIVEHLHRMALDRHYVGSTSYTVFLDTDTPLVEETARGLYQRGTALGSLDRAFATARFI